ncbi:MAG: dnaA, partial [Pseudonocardiales bacterium]|nr:dnaA [Pseudonocardiales bacterium]
MDDRTELVDVWNRAKSRFDDNTIRPQEKAWINLTRPLGLVEDTALLAAPNAWAKEYLETRLRPLISSVLSEELGRDIRVAVTIEHVDEPAETVDDPAGTQGGYDSTDSTDAWATGQSLGKH